MAEIRVYQEEEKKDLVQLTLPGAAARDVADGNSSRRWSPEVAGSSSESTSSEAPRASDCQLVLYASPPILRHGKLLPAAPLPLSAIPNSITNI